MSNFENIKNNIKDIDNISSDKKITKQELYKLQEIIEKYNTENDSNEINDIYKDTSEQIKELFKEKLNEMLENGIHIETESEYQDFLNMISKTDLAGKYNFPEFSRLGYIKVELNNSSQEEIMYFSKLKDGGFVITSKREKFVEVNQSNSKRNPNLTKDNFNYVKTEKTNLSKDFETNIRLTNLEQKSKEFKNLKTQFEQYKIDFNKKIYEIESNFDDKIEKQKLQKNEILVHMYTIQSNLESKITQLETQVKEQGIDIKILNSLLEEAQKELATFNKIKTTPTNFGESIGGNVVNGEGVDENNVKFSVNTDSNEIPNSKDGDNKDEENKVVDNKDVVNKKEDLVKKGTVDKKEVLSSKIHTVLKGQNLWTIVKYHYGLTTPGQVKRKIQKVIDSQDEGRTKTRLKESAGSKLWVGDKIKLEKS